MSADRILLDDVELEELAGPPRFLGYTEAIGRNPGEELQHSHLYAEFMGPGKTINGLSTGADRWYTPMCIYGWNRSDGEAFSIFRGRGGARGLCRVCAKRADAGLPPIEDAAGSHKTRWL